MIIKLNSGVDAYININHISAVFDVGEKSRDFVVIQLFSGEYIWLDRRITFEYVMDIIKNNKEGK